MDTHPAPHDLGLGQPSGANAIPHRARFRPQWIPDRTTAHVCRGRRRSHLQGRACPRVRTGRSGIGAASAVRRRRGLSQISTTTRGAGAAKVSYAPTRRDSCCSFRSPMACRVRPTARDQPDWRPTEHWRLYGSYSFLRLNLRNKSGNGDIGAVKRDEGSSPRHQASVQSRLDLSPGWELDQTVRYVSAIPPRVSRTRRSIFESRGAGGDWKLRSRMGFVRRGTRRVWPRSAADRRGPAQHAFLAPHVVALSLVPSEPRP